MNPREGGSSLIEEADFWSRNDVNDFSLERARHLRQH